MEDIEDIEMPDEYSQADSNGLQDVQKWEEEKWWDEGATSERADEGGEYEYDDANDDDEDAAAERAVTFSEDRARNKEILLLKIGDAGRKVCKNLDEAEKVLVATGIPPGKLWHHFLSGPLSMGKKMDLPLAQLRSLLVSKICLLGSHWLTRTHCLHHMFKSWTVQICWESLRAKETTHIKHASFPFSTDNRKCPKMVQKIQILTLAPHHGRLALLRFRFTFL